MTPESLAALSLINNSKKKLTKEQFIDKFLTLEEGERILNTILVSHVEEVNGKLVLNEAGQKAVK